MCDSYTCAGDLFAMVSTNANEAEEARAPRAIVADTTACTCCLNACGSPVRGPGTLMGCPREIVGRLPTFALSYKENEYFLNGSQQL